MSSAKKSHCSHPDLILTPSSHALIAGYKQPPLPQRLAATTSRGTLNSKSKSSSSQKEPSSSTFPAPLVLPGDELAYDPTYPPQSFCSWVRGKHRNKVTPERNVIYLAAPPELEDGLEFAGDWMKPRGWKAGKGNVNAPKLEDVRKYLEAFYHGMEVKMLPETLKFLGGEEDVQEVQKKKGKKENVTKSPTLWINSGSELIGVRSRPTPKELYTHQLNLNDLLDAAIEILPDNAYAMLMLVHHDIYEDEDDDFACGRAYGGSRVAVVSSARYNPVLDTVQGLEDMAEHCWPGSHCQEYVERLCEEEDESGIKRLSKKAKTKSSNSRSGPSISKEADAKSPIASAIQSFLSEPKQNSADVWLNRICRTASHELGHCFGIDHCVYYACIMQGTAGLAEDARQPPYLCPVDMAKVLKATGATEEEWYEALLRFCGGFGVGGGAFAGYAAWLKARLHEIRDKNKKPEVIVLD